MVAMVKADVARGSPISLAVLAKVITRVTVSGDARPTVKTAASLSRLVTDSKSPLSSRTAR